MAEDDLTTPQGGQEGAQDILFLKIAKLLESTHRQFLQQIMEALVEGSKEQTEILESVVNVICRQLRRSKNAGAKVYAWRTLVKPENAVGGEPQAAVAEQGGE